MENYDEYIFLVYLGDAHPKHIHNVCSSSRQKMYNDSLCHDPLEQQLMVVKNIMLQHE
jgi:hypothetical protein